MSRGKFAKSLLVTIPFIHLIFDRNLSVVLRIETKILIETQQMLLSHVHLLYI